MNKKILKCLLVILMLVGIGFSLVNFISTNITAAAIDGADIVDKNGNAFDCAPNGNQCKIVTPDPPIGV